MIIYTYDCSFHPPSRAAHPQENRLNWPRVRLQRLCLTLHSHSTYQSHLLTLKKSSQSALKARRHLASLRANPRQNHRPSPAVSHPANHLVNPVHSHLANLWPYPHQRHLLSPALIHLANRPANPVHSHPPIPLAGCHTLRATYQSHLLTLQ